MKVCSVCQIEKAKDMFRPYKGRSKDGLRPLCKNCQREYEKKWRNTSKESRKRSRQKRREKDKLYRQKWIVGNRAKYLVSQVRRNAKKKNLPFDLDAHVAEIQSRIDAGICEVSKYPLDTGVRGGRVFNTPSIDRIEPKKGYVYSNIRIVCFAINAAFGDWGLENTKKVMNSWLGDS